MPSDIERRLGDEARDPRAPDAPTRTEQFANDAVNALGDMDAANAPAGPGVIDPPPEPTAQMVRRYPDLYDDETKAQFQHEDLPTEPPVDDNVDSDVDNDVDSGVDEESRGGDYSIPDDNSSNATSDDPTVFHAE